MTRVEVDRTDMRLLLRALRDEADGKEMRRDLVRGLRVAVEPAAAAARASILSMGVHGRSHPTPGLRASVARATKVSVRTGRNRPGVVVRVKKTKTVRGFDNAPKRLNSKKGWRHPVPVPRREREALEAAGLPVEPAWVTQMGKPGWFDEPMKAAAPAAIAAAELTLDNVARRISAKTRG